MVDYTRHIARDETSTHARCTALRRTVVEPGLARHGARIIKHTGDGFLAGFVRIHILHHAAETEVYGQWLIEELARHGYRISPGTLYPMLQAMEERGYLTSREDSDGRLGRRRKVYTEPGKADAALLSHASGCANSPER